MKIANNEEYKEFLKTRWRFTCPYCGAKLEATHKDIQHLDTYNVDLVECYICEDHISLGSLTYMDKCFLRLRQNKEKKWKRIIKKWKKKGK